jgi:predicted transcriptional regulator of viral defense system
MSPPLSHSTLPAVFTTREASQLGLSGRRLYALREKGLIEPLGRGLFMRAGTQGDPDLIEIAKRALGATLCLTSALARHDLTDQIPGSIHVACKRSQRQPRTQAPVTWHRFAEATFDVGREEFTVAEGCTLGCYGPARSIIDAFRLGHLEGREVAIEALRRWLKRRGNQPSELLSMARNFPTSQKAIRSALEILL